MSLEITSVQYLKLCIRQVVTIVAGSVDCGTICLYTTFFSQRHQQTQSNLSIHLELEKSKGVLSPPTPEKKICASLAATFYTFF